MKWFLAELVKGENYPHEINWPNGIEAFIPLSDNLINQPTISPGRSSVQLFWKRSQSDGLHPVVWINDNGQQECMIDLHGWIKSLKNESYRPAHKKPLSAILPFHYHYIPGTMRNLIWKVILKVRGYSNTRGSVFPVSNLNGGCEILLGLCDARWNLGVDLPVLVLTHDIDSEDGFQWVEKIASVEEKYGFRSSWNVVPKKYNINEGILFKLLKEGHEIGLHGLWHNNKEAFLNEAKMRKEFRSLKDFMDNFSIKGYRSPCWYRTHSMFQVLSEFFAYDLSCLDNDLTLAGSGGVGFMRPFRMDSGLVELPCTVPFEAPLFINNSPEGDISCESFMEYWMPKIQFIKESEGMLLSNSHPDPYYSGNDRLLNYYDNFLKTLADQNWHAKLPSEIVKDINDFKIP